MITKRRLPFVIWIKAIPGLFELRHIKSGDPDGGWVPPIIRYVNKETGMVFFECDRCGETGATPIELKHTDGCNGKDTRYGCATWTLIYPEENHRCQKHMRELYRRDIDGFDNPGMRPIEQDERDELKRRYEEEISS